MHRNILDWLPPGASPGYWRSTARIVTNSCDGDREPEGWCRRAFGQGGGDHAGRDGVVGVHLGGALPGGHPSGVLDEAALKATGAARKRAFNGGQSDLSPTYESVATAFSGGPSGWAANSAERNGTFVAAGEPTCTAPGCAGRGRRSTPGRAGRHRCGPRQGRPAPPPAPSGIFGAQVRVSVEHSAWHLPSFTGTSAWVRRWPGDHPACGTTRGGGFIGGHASNRPSPAGDRRQRQRRRGR
jgi:hypothetical protein